MLSALITWIFAARPAFVGYTKAEDEKAVEFIVPAKGGNWLRADLRYLTRFSVVFGTMMVLLTATLMLVAGGPALSALRLLIYGLLGGFALQCIRAWIASAAEMVIRVEQDRLSYRFTWHFVSRSQQWAREDVTAVRWSGYKSIRIFGQRGEPIGRMVLLTLPERWVASLSREVRIEFGF